MRTYQFIKNQNGEVVNVDKITAVSFDYVQKPYEIRVYTPATKFGIAFHYDNIEKMCRAVNNLEQVMCITCNLRIVKFANWWIAADGIESISDCASGIRVRMDNGQNFDIMIESHEEIKATKQEIEASLVRMCVLKDLDVDDGE